MDDDPRQQEQDEQRREAVGIGGAAGEVEVELAEQRPHHHALQPVGAAGPLRQGIGCFVQHQRDGQGHHQARKVAAAQHQQAGDRAQHGGDRHGDGHAQQRIGGDELAEQAGGIGARAEEGGVAERDDAGIAQDQVEREREQGEDRHLVQQQVLARRQEERGEGQQPEDDLGQPPAGAPGEACRDAHLARANRPCGRSTSTTISTT
jgi:hypothetical protein